MSADQRKSFIAEIQHNAEPLNLRTVSAADVDFWGEVMRGCLAPLSPLAFIATELFRTIEEVPFLTTRYRGKVPEPGRLLAYFRCYGNYYNIQIRSEDQLGNFLSKHSSGLLGAFPAAGGDTTSFNLLDASNNIITLDELDNDNVEVFLKARNAGVICSKRDWNKNDDVWSDIRLFNDKSGDPALFTLRILQRNVPYPTTDAALEVGDISMSARTNS